MSDDVRLSDPARIDNDPKRVVLSCPSPTFFFKIPIYPKMKNFCLSLLTAVTLIAAPSTVFGDEVSVKAAEFLTPQDIGATKFNLTAKVEKGKVAIFTMVRKTTGIREDVLHLVSYGEGEKTQSVCAVNPDFFHPREDGKETWHVAAYKGTAWFPGRLIQSSWGGEQGTLLFKEDETTTLVTYKVFVISLEAARKVYKNLPSSELAAWEWCGEPM